MAQTFKSNQMTLVDAGSKVKTQEFHGRKRAMYFDITLPASGLATGDDIRLGILPKGARVLGGKFVWGTVQGATATLAIGYAGATARFFAAAVTNALTVNRMADTIAQNYGDELTVETVVLATNAAAAWTASSVLKGELEYLVD